MTDFSRFTPLLGKDSALNQEARAILESVVRHEAERARQRTYDPLGPKARQRVEVSWDELVTQPQAIEETLGEEREAISQLAASLATQPISRVCIVGCGDSWISGIGVRSLFEAILRVPCEPLQALDFAYYYSQVVDERTLVLSLSSSGASPRSVEAMLMAQAQGAVSVAMTNTADSLMMQAADRSLLIHATRVGWPTQASTAAMAMMSQLAIDIARAKGFSSGTLDKLQAALDATPDQIAAVLEAHSDSIADIAEAEAHREMYLFAGGGPAYAAAMFGAAKVKEMTPNHSYAIPQEEFHHYHSLRPGDPLFIIAPHGPSVPRAMQTAERGKAWDGQVYAAVTQGSPLKDIVDAAFELPDMDERLSGLVYTVPAQLFAYHVAMAKFR